MTFSIQRYDNGNLMHSMADLEEVIAFGILEIIWGHVPDEVRVSEVEQQHKFHLGGPHWVIVTRVS